MYWVSESIILSRAHAAKSTALLRQILLAVISEVSLGDVVRDYPMLKIIMALFINQSQKAKLRRRFCLG